MTKKKELAKNTIILTVGKICTQFVGFFLLPLYTSILSTDEYGVYDLFASYIAVILPLVSWQLDQGMFRYILDVREDEKKITEIFSSVFVANVFQCILVSLVYCIVRMIILKSEYSIYLLISIIVNIFTGLLMQFARGIGKMLYYSVSSFLTAISTIIFNIIFIVIYNMGAHGLFIAGVLGMLVNCFYLTVELKIWRYIRISKFNLNILYSICKYSVPMIPNQISGWVLSVSDRTIICKFLNVSINGIYTVANKFSNLIGTFFGFFNLAWIEMVSIHFNDDDSEEFISDMMHTVFNIFYSVCIGLISLMPFVFSLLVKGEYKDSYNHIPILLIGALFQVLFGLYSAIYIALKETKSIAKTTIISGFINIIINVLLIRIIGLYAASISTLISFGFAAIYRAIDSRRFIKIHYNICNVIMNLVVACITIVGYYLNNSIIHYIIITFVILYCLYINKKMIFLMISETKKHFLYKE